MSPRTLNLVVATNKNGDEFFYAFENELDALDECHNLVGEFVSTRGDEEDIKKIEADRERWGYEVFHEWQEWLAEISCHVYIEHASYSRETEKGRLWRIRKEVEENVSGHVHRRGD